MTQDSNWNSFARVNASQKWRRQSAAMGAAMTEAIVAEARVLPGMAVLDIACGTGEPAISLATLMAGSGRVVATDISVEPLKIAEQRAQERRLNNIEFVPADAHQLPFSDATFDRVTSRLGVMFFSDVPRVLQELRRVLKPGGQASLLAWGPFEQPYFQTTVGTLLRLSPELQIPASGAAMFRFGRPGTLASLLEEAGFAKIEETGREVAWNWPGLPEELWEWFLAVTVPFRSLFDAVRPERRREVDAAVIAALQQHYDGQEVRFAAQVVLASGIRP